MSFLGPATIHRLNEARAKRQATLEARSRLELTLRPDPTYRENRLRQFDTARREKYFENIRKVWG